MCKSYVIVMTVLTLAVTTDMALSYFPQTGMSKLTHEQALARKAELNNLALANSWDVYFEIEEG